MIYSKLIFFSNIRNLTFEWYAHGVCTLLCRQEISALSTETVGISPKHDDIVNTKQRKLSDSMVPEQSIVPVVVPQQTRAPINGTTVTNATPTAANPQPTGNIPPDLAIMSDHDLISYINPSCFDQGTYST